MGAPVLTLSADLASAAFGSDLDGDGDEDAIVYHESWGLGAYWQVNGVLQQQTLHAISASGSSGAATARDR